ncbi:MAG: hydroxyacid dehydrogenase [Promethearchaeia archaeon]
MKVLIANKVHKKGINLLEDNGFQVDEDYTLSPAELKEKIGDYEGIVIRSGTKLTADVLEQAEKLKIIGRAGVGLDNVDLKRAEELNIKVVNTPEAPSVSVAELTMGLMLSIARHISKADETMHCGNWYKSNYMGFTLEGKKIGIIGFGNIGQEVAKRSAAFGMDVGIYDVDKTVKEKAKKLNYQIYPSVDELVKEAKYITLHIPATVHTENTINQKRLELMRDDTIIINTARGNLIDEEALIKALKNEQIGGAALDVYKQEPLGNSEFCECTNNLILTPHIGSQTIETQIQASVMAAEKIISYLKKQK